MNARLSNPANTAPPPVRGPVSGYVLAVLVLVGSLILLVLFWRNAYQREMQAAQEQFARETREITELMQQRLVNYELTLRGGVALFATVARPTPQQWRTYVDGFHLPRRFPAMTGLGYAAYVDTQGLQALQLEMRDSGYGLLQVRPRGVREYYGPILYLQPATRENLSAIGFDMYVEPVRHAAMLAARDSGEPRLSGRVSLVQDGGRNVSGALLYSPVYRAGDSPGNLAARRLSLRGWVFVPFRMSRFVQAALAPIERSASFQLYDVTDDAQTLLHADPGHDQVQAAFQHSVWTEVYGRRWRYDFRSGPLAVAAPQLQDLGFTIGIGLLASLLLFAVAWTLARTEASAERMAMRMTESYRRSELRFRTAMHYSAIGKVLLDAGGRIVEANPAFAQLLGRPADGMAGAMFNALFLPEGHPVDRSGVDHAGETLLAGGVQRTTRQLRRHDGDLRELQLTRAPVPGDIGQDIAQLVQVEDVTDRVRAENRVHALNRTLEARVELRTRELTQANRELESFAYSVSHDLRAPLRAIDGFSRVLLDRHHSQLDDGGRNYLARVRSAAGRMDELIESLLQMSRASLGELKPASIDLSQLAADVVQELRSSDPGRKVQVDIAPGMQAVGSPVLVRSLLQNLIGNAWKFSGKRDDACIQVGTVGAGDGQEFFVRDNGAGFAPEYAGKLFRPFQRMHDDDQFPGHGIGLASVKRIVERHGGEVRAEGQVGEGATFWFSLKGDASAD